jgi:hypothetical protein
MCRELAGKVAARRGRESASEEAVLRELLRQIESHLGRKPVDLSRHTGDGAQGIRGEIDRLFDTSGGAAWAPIANDELLAGLFPSGKAAGARATSGRSAREDA